MSKEENSGEKGYQDDFVRSRKRYGEQVMFIDVLFFL